MNITIVSCFDTYEQRIDLLISYFTKKGHNVNVIMSDFKHIEKVRRTDKKNNYKFVETNSYFNNLSLSRLYSHYRFARDAFREVKKINPDMIYVIIPANSLAYFADRFKKNNPHIRLYIDIMDLWPETMPISGNKLKIPFYLWKKVRDRNLKNAEMVITECSLYNDVLKKQLAEINSGTLYLAKSEQKSVIEIMKLSDDELHLCYLGSINNIIDIPQITNIIRRLNAIKPTIVHIIGDGEKKELFIHNLIEIGVKVENYGKIYDHNKKREILSKCHFGINIMKNDVCVGLTMKSIDYLYYGLPIINNIKADTYCLVNNNYIGFNIIDEQFDDIIEKICSLKTEDIYEMKSNAINVFNEYFSISAFENKLNEIFEGVENEK
jgi:hypothetical protein